MVIFLGRALGCGAVVAGESLGAAMGLKADLSLEIDETFSRVWKEETTTSIPTPEVLRLNANHAKQLEGATVLYADLDSSTAMVDNYNWQFSAEIYKTYLRCASRIIKSEGGTITAYDGDRVMAVFVGDTKNTTAVRAALKINYAVGEILQPAIRTFYPNTDFLVNHVVGIDTGTLRAARIGVRGDNDIVWIGRAANYAAKLCTLPEKPLWITKDVYIRLMDEVKFHNGNPMWKKMTWNSMNKMEIYCSTYRYKVE